MKGPLLLEDWRRTTHGTSVAFTHPAGAHAGRIPVYPRLPLRPLPELVAQLRENAARKLDTVLVEGPTPMATADGEYAFVTRVTGTAASTQAQYSVGHIFGDDAVAAIEATTTDPARFATLHDAAIRLVYRHSLGLGTDRWRRFHHVPPPGWTGVALDHAVTWLHPAYPRTRALITVFDARPSLIAVSTVQYNRMFTQIRLDRVAAPRPSVRLAHARLRGERSAFEGTDPETGRSTVMLLARLNDERYTYAARLLCDAALEAGVTPVFDALVASIRALPPRAGEIDELVAWREPPE